MKKFLLILLVLTFIPCFNVYAQGMPVIDAALATLMGTLHIDQAIHYAKMVSDNIQQIALFKEMIENSGKQIGMAAQNLASAKDIKSWDDFMDFYNRQLYLERQAVETWDNMNITIGKKQYAMNDIFGIAEGLKETHVDYWTKEFTEEQRREMWLGLGLTPANYAYVQPFREKAREIAKQNLTAVSIQNEWYKRNMENNNERQKKLADDKLKSDENKMGMKEVMMMTLESLLETNKVLNDMAMNQAKEMEKNSVDDALGDTPNTAPPLADWSMSRKGFERLSGHSPGAGW